MRWLERHSQALQALGALLTAVFALVALLGVKLQLDTTERISREAQARDIYRSYLSLSINTPQFASPGQCPSFNETELGAYYTYVEYLLYTAEQVTAMDASWAETFEVALSDHLAFICTEDDWNGYTDEVAALIRRTQAANCADRPICG